MRTAFKVAFFLLLGVVCVLAQHNKETGKTYGDPSIIVAYRANEAVTGTIQYRLATSNTETPPKFIVAPLGAQNFAGICIENCGTTGTATIVTQGSVSCEFDNAPTSRNIVIASVIDVGKCHDTGVSIDAGWPNRGRLVGLSLATAGTAGIYTITLLPQGTFGSIQASVSPTGQFVKDDGTFGNPTAGSVEWANVLNKPSTFAPSAHPHVKADISDFSHSHSISDTTGLQTALDGKEPANANIQSHIASTSNPHSVTKAQVGLANADNTSDVNKPISTATQTALDGKQATLGFTPENSANKGAASGYASLDAGTKIPIAQIPTGSTASTVAIGNDARLSDARTPLAHTHVGGDVTSAVGTATALAGNGTNCSGGQAATGVDASGNAEGCFTPGGGSGVVFREFHVCSGTCVAFTNLGAGPTEMGSQASRNNIDLSGFTDARIVVNLSVTATTGDFQVECGDTTAFSPITDLLQWDNPTANALIVGTWTTIPAGCKTAGGVYIRVVGISGNGTEDPNFRFIKLQVR